MVSELKELSLNICKWQDGIYASEIRIGIYLWGVAIHSGNAIPSYIQGILL